MSTETTPLSGSSGLSVAPCRLRIAHVSLGLDVGGQERLLVEFARHADRTRFELAFVSLSTRGRLAETLESLGWPVLALNEPSGVRPGMIWRLARLFHRHRFDIVHTHDDKPLLYGSLAAKLARVRLVHTHHHGLLPQTSRRQRRMVAWAGRLTQAFVCVSHDSARYMEESGLPRRRQVTLWNGIDLDKYAYQGPNGDGPALTVARLSPEKDVANLLRAAALVVRAAGGFRLHIAGDGVLRENLVQLANTLNLQDHVRFLGEVRDIPTLLGQARLFVLPSQTEGISLTILEAMARGLPVVATRVGGNPEVVQEGKTGLLVPAGDSEALAQAILKVWQSAELGERMGRAGRMRVEAQFDVRAMVARYERLYLGACVVNKK